MLPSFTGFIVGIFLLLQSLATTPSEHVLASHSFSLENRYASDAVNDVFKDNILLNLAYLRGSVRSKAEVNWDEIRKPFSYTLTLEPGEVFAYHEDVLPQFEAGLKTTTNAHFNAQDGFRSSGYLFGDGVCHLASLIYYAAKDAGLEAVSPTNHDFAKIPEVPSEYGVSIYFMPGNKAANARQNLYVRNNDDVPVLIEFVYENDELTVAVKHEQAA